MLRAGGEKAAAPIFSGPGALVLERFWPEKSPRPGWRVELRIDSPEALNLAVQIVDHDNRYRIETVTYPSVVVYSSRAENVTEAQAEVRYAKTSSTQPIFATAGALVLERFKETSRTWVRSHRLLSAEELVAAMNLVDGIIRKGDTQQPRRFRIVTATAPASVVYPGAPAP